MKKLYLLSLSLLACFLILMNFNGYGQLSITTAGSNYTINFDVTVDGVNNGQYAGSGFEPSPAAGRLDSDAWATTGMDGGSSNFGGTYTTPNTDFTRGTSSGNVTTGGFYAFTVGTGDRGMGIQPGSDDWTPGTITLRIINNTGGDITGFNISYNVYVRNDQGRSNTFNFSYSVDNSIYTTVPELNYTSAAAADPTPAWVANARSTTITGLTLTNGSYFYFRWDGNDAGGSGSRDEFALNDIVISASGSASEVANPGAFNAVAVSVSEVDLSWVPNINSDSVLIAYNTVNTFGDPAGVYAIGDPITGGGTILYKRTGTDTTHVGLTPDTEYFYKAWSFTNAYAYSTGVLDSATTLKPEPSSFPGDFTVNATGITITCDWTDATGETLPDAYLILLSEQDNIIAPVDGTPVADDRNAADGAAAINVPYGLETFTFFRLEETSVYYVKIFPYTNTGTFIDYLTIGAPPALPDTTQSIIATKDFEDNLWGDWTTYNVTSDKVWQNLNTGGGAYGTSRYASMSGYYSTGGELSNDWLISPPLNLDLFTDDKMIFFNSWNFGTNENELKVKYSTDYIGGDPTGATWTELAYTKATTSLTWVPSGFIDLSEIEGSDVYIAFQYLSESFDGAARTWRVDEVEITGNTVANPSDFNATTFSDTQIDLTWNLNLDNDSVLIAVNSINTFGIPAGVYALNDEIAGGGTVIYKGTGEAFSHTGLAPFSNYYYRAWSMTEDHTYSSGVDDNALTYKAEPSQYPANFSSTAANITITATWTDAAGDQLPDAYLLLISNQDNIAAPVDGALIVNDLDLSDGAGAFNVAYGLGTYTFYHLNSDTEYFLEIYPYTSASSGVNYKTDDPVPATSATTEPVILQEGFNDGTFGAWTPHSIASNKNWTVITYMGALNTTGCAQINGYQGDEASNDWLVSPSLDLDMYTDEIMVFYTLWSYGTIDTELKLLYSTNYTGGNPTLATWTELGFTKPNVQDVWASSGNVDLSAITGSTVTFAFQYLSGADPRWWRLDEIVITGTELEVIDNPTSFLAVAISDNEISLSWTKNANSDDVVVAWNSENVFGKPEGPLYEGNEIPGGGFVIYRGQEEFFNHGGLNPETPYYYKAWSVDMSDNYSSGATAEATTFFAEPAEHPTGFAAEADSYSQITVTWTDSDADSYLVKGSSVSPASIIDPVDLVPENDGALVQNVAAGTQTAVFTNLLASTKYYFKIYPYNGAGIVTNYKTDGEVPLDSATTAGVELNLIISEVTDPSDIFQCRYVELMNIGTNLLDFSSLPVYLARQANGNPLSWANIQLTGTLAPGETYVVANSSTSFPATFGIAADIYSGNISGDGNDGYFIYYGGPNSSGTLIDAYGVIDQDGVGKDWYSRDKKAVRKRSVTGPNVTWTASEWSIPSTLTNTQDMTPDYHLGTVTWQGSVSTNWNTKGDNWNSPNGYIPDASCNVVIPFTGITNFPVVTAPSIVNQVELQSDEFGGASLIITGTGSLLIVGEE